MTGDVLFEEMERRLREEQGVFVIEMPLRGFRRRADSDVLTASRRASYRRAVKASDILRSAKTVLLVDYPSREVPDTLARAGHAVFAHGGPGPEDYLAYNVEGERVTERWIGQPPRQADLVYVYRPVEELPAIVQDARRVGATAVWCETGSHGARQIVEGAGLVYVDEPSIVNVAHITEA